MTTQKSYFVERKMILMTGEYNPFGKLCTRVVSGASAFLVDRTPLQLLDDTLTSIGFDLKGAVTGAKSILDKKAKCPIIVNPYLGICLFPTESPQNADCIWFNPKHIVKTTGFGKNTVVEMSNGYTMIVDSKVTAFNDKIQKAQQLLTLSAKRGIHPNAAINDHTPKKNDPFTREKSGKYPFDQLEEEQK
ncbi:competence protein ComK [Neobacillus sp. Marseille-QA0830]